MTFTDDLLNDMLATLEVRVLGGAHTHCGLSWAPLDRQWADPFGRLYWPRTGAGWTEHHGQRFDLRPGVLTLIPPHTIARYQCPDAMGLDWLHFTATVLHSLDFFSFLSVPYEILIPDPAWLDGLWDGCIGRQQGAGLGQSVFREGCARLLLGLFLEHANTTALSRALRGMAQFHPVLGFIEAHLSEKLPLARLAEVANLHPSYFSTRFAEVVGVGPVGYVNQRRIAFAKRLLRETTDTQESIAIAVGYGDAYYFSRLFKQTTGMSPGQYRRLSMGCSP